MKEPHSCFQPFCVSCGSEFEERDEEGECYLLNINSKREWLLPGPKSCTLQSHTTSNTKKCLKEKVMPIAALVGIYNTYVRERLTA